MKQFSILILICLFTSCDFFASKEEKTSKLVNEQLKHIDWTAIDNYPLFDNCDETVSKVAQRICFEKELLKHCSKALQEFDFQINTVVDPKISVDFLVDQDGQITIVNIQKDMAIDAAMPEFDQIITKAIKNIPPLAPALKRGIPVKTKFRIPIILKNN